MYLVNLTLSSFCANHSQFVRVTQALLNILIGKAGLVEKAPFVGPPVAASLRGFEGNVDVSTSILRVSISALPDLRATQILRCLLNYLGYCNLSYQSHRIPGQGP